MNALQSFIDINSQWFPYIISGHAARMDYYKVTLSERFPEWAVILLVAAIFYIGHAVFIPDVFASVHVLPSLSIFGLGIVMVVLILHLSFYFIFAF
ncbi:hypothetical protein ACDX78_03550 [Virgibacillus oceani]